MTTGAIATMMETTIQGVESILQLTFTKQRGRLWEACQAAGSPYATTTLYESPTEANKRLAQIGDACATLWIWSRWYGSQATRGIFRTLRNQISVNDCAGSGDTQRQQILCNKNLAAQCRALQLEQFLHCNPGTERISDDMMATMMEAIIGAAFFEGNMACVNRVMKSLGLNPDAV